MEKYAWLLLFLFLTTGLNFLRAQETGKRLFSKAIEDNSFFIEEAYNQEDRVVQHINNGIYTHGTSKDFTYSFTQEWPVFSQKHQFSYSLGFTSINSGNSIGFNDIMLNYRYQLTGHDNFVTLAPRISVIIPTGNDEKRIGSGVWGFQANLPMSKRISNRMVVHSNIGLTLLPGVNITDENDITHSNLNSEYFFGASIIWLVTDKTNLMLEVLHVIERTASPQNEMVNNSHTVLSPGLRHAFDLNNLQIVPGIAIPVIVHDNNVDAGVFLYLSFEHPF